MAASVHEASSDLTPPDTWPPRRRSCGSSMILGLDGFQSFSSARQSLAAEPNSTLKIDALQRITVAFDNIIRTSPPQILFGWLCFCKSGT